MSNHVLILFGVFLVLFLLQSAGGIFQIKDYEKAVRRVNRDGAVGIGQKRGRLLSGGHIVILACDDGGKITAEKLWTGFHFWPDSIRCLRFIRCRYWEGIFGKFFWNSAA